MSFKNIQKDQIENVDISQVNSLQTELDGKLSTTGTAADSTKVGGITITGTPTVGQVATATSGTAATWQDASGGTSYPSNIYESASQTFNANTVYTFTHNLGLSQTDIEDGRYKFVACVGLNEGLQAGDTTFTTFTWGDGSTIRSAHDWQAGSPSNTRSVWHQTNAFKIKWGSSGSYYGKVILQQMY